MILGQRLGLTVAYLFHFTTVAWTASSSQLVQLEPSFDNPSTGSSSSLSSLRPAILIPRESTIDYRDILHSEETPEEPYGYMVNADQFQDLMKKAVLSADKDKKYPLFGAAAIGPSASKWLTRVEAAIRKDPEMITAMRNYYIDKANRVATTSARARALAKGDMWMESVNQGARMESYEDEIELTGDRYEELADHLWEEYMKNQSDGEKDDVLEAIDAKYQQAVAMKNFWENGKDPYMARVYAQMELRDFNEAWTRHVAEPNNWSHSMDMQKATARAVAWNMRVRQIQLEKKARKIADKLQRKGSGRSRHNAT